MAHPYFHAVSTSRKLGGTPEDSLPLHTWMDATKAHYAHCSHRALRHSVEGIDLAVRRHGPTLQSSIGPISTRDVAEQHVIEDCGFIPTTAQWLERFTMQPWMTGKRLTAQDCAKASAAQYGGIPNDYKAVHDFIDGDGAFASGPFMAVRHHSEGCFLSEEIFGVTVNNSDGRPVPVRFLTEQHLKLHFGRMPTVQDWLRNLRPNRWMRMVGDPKAGQKACGSCACRPLSV